MAADDAVTIGGTDLNGARTGSAEADAAGAGAQDADAAEASAADANVCRLDDADTIARVVGATESGDCLVGAAMG
jgi:hypothetical protein